MNIGTGSGATRSTHLRRHCEGVFVDTASGKLARRPALDQALLVSRSGDQLVVTKLNRLGRSLGRLIALSRDLQARVEDLVVLDQGIAPVGRRPSSRPARSGSPGDVRRGGPGRPPGAHGAAPSRGVRRDTTDDLPPPPAPDRMKPGGPARPVGSVGVLLGAVGVSERTAARHLGQLGGVVAMDVEVPPHVRRQPGNVLVSHRVAVCPQPVQGGVEVDGIQQVGVVGVESQ